MNFNETTTIILILLSIISIIIAIIFGTQYYGLKKQISVASYGQTGGITAGEINLGAIQRQVTPDFISGLENNLKMIKAKRIIITSVGLSMGENYIFANEIKSKLESDGWKVEGINQAIYSQPIIGVVLDLKLDSNGYANLIVGTQ